MDSQDNVTALKGKTQVNRDEEISQKVRLDLISLLYEQIPIGIVGQFLVSAFVVIVLWQGTPNLTVILWGLYMLVIPSIWMAFAILFRYKPKLFDPETWLIFFPLSAFFSACGWGYVDSILMPKDYIVNQSFVIIIVIGMTACASSFFSTFVQIYALFLFPSFVPVTIWLFFQSGLYLLLGVCAIVYMVVIFGNCYHANRFIVSSLTFRYKNIDLDSLNQFLEKRVEERTSDLEKSLAIIKSTLESTADGILVVDKEGKIEFSNQNFLDMWSFASDYMSLRQSKIYIDHILQQINEPEKFKSTLKDLQENPTKVNYDELYFTDGKVFEWYSKPHKIRNKIVGRVWSFRDITHRKQMEQQLFYQAHHDLLTGLPNRTLLYDRIKQGINYANRYNHYLTMLFLDIDNFKLINDNLGHDSGDILLKEVASRLRECVRASDTVARFGGDEFVILFTSKQLD